MISIPCCELTCGVVFGLPDHLYQQAKENPERWWWCPNGHRQHYAKDVLAELKADVERKRSAITRLEDEVSRKERTISYWKGIVSRLRGKKLAGGRS